MRVAWLLLFAGFCLLLVAPFAVANPDPSSLIPPTLVDWVGVLLRFPSGWSEWGFICAGLVGMIGHWYKKKRRGETHASIIDHFIANYPKSTFATLFVFWFVAVYLLEAVAIAAAHPGGAIAVGLSVGWWLDSMINKGSHHGGN